MWHHHQGAVCRDETCAMAKLTRVKVTLFKASGTYYTEEEWRVPTEVRDSSPRRGFFVREAIVPADMLHSPDFRRIDGGPVLINSQEPWGYPHLFPATEV